MTSERNPCTQAFPWIYFSLQDGPQILKNKELCKDTCVFLPIWGLMSLGTCGLFKDLTSEFEREAAQRLETRKKRDVWCLLLLFEGWLGDDMRNSGVFIEQRIRDLFRLFSHPPIPSHLGFHLSASAPVHLTRLSIPPCSVSALVVAGARLPVPCFVLLWYQKPGQTDSSGQTGESWS